MCLENWLVQKCLLGPTTVAERKHILSLPCSN